MSEYTKEQIEKARENGTLDEKCSCGHLKSQHNDRYQKGHGDCKVCKCKQFTWVGWFINKR